MSDCRHGGRDTYAPMNRVDIRIKFTDEHELDYHLPLDLMEREIACIEVDGERYEKAKNHGHRN